MDSVNPMDLLSAITNVAKGGSTKAIITGIVTLLLVGAYIWLKKKVTDAEVAAATKSTDAASSAAQAAAPIISETKETQAKTDQAKLLSADEIDTLNMLNALPMGILTRNAIAAYGKDVYEAAVKTGMTDAEMRAAIYTLYGLKYNN